MGGGAPTPASQSERLDEDGWVGRWAKRFAHFDKPLIGAVNGVAITGGVDAAPDDLDRLLDRLVAPENLLDEAVMLANEMAQWPPLAMRMSKRVLQHNQDAGLEEALRYESVGLGFGRKAVNDGKESIAAFAEKRKGVYTGN